MMVHQMSSHIQQPSVKHICFKCIGDDYLRDKVHNIGRRQKCDYCSISRKSLSVADLAEDIQAAFEIHYFRSADQPDGLQYSMLRDRESDYEWERDGEAVVDAIMNAADIPHAAAEDIQSVLNDKHSDFEAQKIGEETEFHRNRIMWSEDQIRLNG